MEFIAKLGRAVLAFVACLAIACGAGAIASGMAFTVTLSFGTAGLVLLLPSLLGWPCRANRGEYLGVGIAIASTIPFFFLLSLHPAVPSAVGALAAIASGILRRRAPSPAA